MIPLYSIGDKRKFNFTAHEYIIKEIFDEDKFEMEWDWFVGNCPKCKEKITRNIVHKFLRIEVLLKMTIDETKITKQDLIFLGITTDNKYLIIPPTKSIYDEILNKSRYKGVN